jgi:hypothetical protein
VYFATASSHNGGFISQKMCLIMILFHACSMIKDEGNKNLLLLSFLDNIGSLIEKKLRSSNAIVLMQMLPNSLLCSITAI